MRTKTDNHKCSPLVTLSLSLRGWSWGSWFIFLAMGWVCSDPSSGLFWTTLEWWGLRIHRKVEEAVRFRTVMESQLAGPSSICWYTDFWQSELPQEAHEAPATSFSVSKDIWLFRLRSLFTDIKKPLCRVANTGTSKLIPSKYIACVPIANNFNFSQRNCMLAANRAVEDSCQQSESIWDLGRVKAQPTLRTYLKSALLIHVEMKFSNLFGFANDSSILPKSPWGKWFLFWGNGLGFQIHCLNETSVTIGCSYES